jgi:cytochrome c oxidase cbb3-type subunit III
MSKKRSNPNSNYKHYALYTIGLSSLLFFLVAPSLTSFAEALPKTLDVQQTLEDRISDPNTTAAMILDDNELRSYTMKSAKVLYGQYCIKCHGTDGKGNAATSHKESGYPALADGDWLHGGTIDNIQTTITRGRKSVMPNFGKRLTDKEINDLAKHIVALGQGKEHSAGKELFNGSNKGGCIACHGADAKGVTSIGSANLTDSVWRFSVNNSDNNRSLASVRYTIKHGVNSKVTDTKSRKARMPVFGPDGKNLNPATIKKLAVYVHQLGGGH